MKKWIHASSQLDSLELNIDILFGSEVLATDILPVITDNGLLDDQAKADYDDFIETVLELIDYYDFHIYNSYRRTSGSFPYTSQYMWVAHRQEIANDSVHKLIKLRISDHYQNFSKKRQRELNKQAKQEAYELRTPKTKKKQLYEPKTIVVNNSRYSTYEEALAYIEKEIRNWLTDKGIDLSEYESFN